jgi:MFS family permease
MAATTNQKHVDVSDHKEDDVDAGWIEQRSAAQQWIEYVLLNIVFIMWQLDANVLQTFGHQLQVTFKVSQTSIGTMSSVKGWVSMIVGIPVAFMAERVSRVKLICVGCIIWGLGLLICGVAPSFQIILIGRILNGVGLGIVKPLVFSLVADKNPPSKRGMAFGMLYFTAALGNSMITPVLIASAEDVSFGIAGWRVSCMAIAIASSVIGVVVLFAVVETNTMQKPGGSAWASVRENMPKVIQLFKYPTFVLLCVQGGPGSMPWQLVAQFPQWLQLLCFSLRQSAEINFGFQIGNTLSPLIAGALLNLVVRRMPNHGPPSIANFSTGMSPVLAVVMFLLLPKPGVEGASSSDVIVYTGTLFTTGVIVSMCGCVNSLVFSFIVPAPLYVYAYAWDTFLEGAIGNLAPLAVGFLSDHVFHINEEAAQSGNCDPTTGAALGNAMLTVFCAGWGICFLVYLGMHWTYPKDRARVLAETRDEKDAQKVSSVMDVA